MEVLTQLDYLVMGMCLLPIMVLVVFLYILIAEIIEAITKIHKE